MPQPDKNTYPQWAKWLAQDKNGCWWAYSVEPLEHASGWYENEVGQHVLIKKDDANKDWKNTLTKVNG